MLLLTHGLYIFNSFGNWLWLAILLFWFICSAITIILLMVLNEEMKEFVISLWVIEHEVSSNLQLTTLVFEVPYKAIDVSIPRFNQQILNPMVTNNCTHCLPWFNNNPELLLFPSKFSILVWSQNARFIVRRRSGLRRKESKVVEEQSHRSGRHHPSQPQTSEES